jgi:hypothetical protein
MSRILTLSDQIVQHQYFACSWLLQINQNETTQMGSWLPPLSCYHEDHIQLSLLLHKVHCIHVLWDEAILQSFNEPHAYKCLYIIKNNILCISAIIFTTSISKCYRNQTGILHSKQILTLVTVRLLPTNCGHQDSVNRWHLYTISHVNIRLNLQLMYCNACCCALLKLTCIWHISPYSN